MENTVINIRLVKLSPQEWLKVGHVTATFGNGTAIFLKKLLSVLYYAFILCLYISDIFK